MSLNLYIKEVSFKMLKKAFLFSLTLLLFLAIFVAKAETPTFSIGEVTDHQTKVVEDIVYNKYTIKANDITTHIIHNVELERYADFKIVLHDKLYGENATGLSTVLDIALDYEAKTGKMVYAAFNGDFFSTLPIDFYAVDNNILRIGQYNKNAFGFTDAHKTRVGKVDYGYKINIYDETGKYVDYIHIDKLNQSINDGEVGFFTSDLTPTITGSNILKLSVENEVIINNSDFHYEGDILSDINNLSFNDLDYQVKASEFVIGFKGDSSNYQKLISLIDEGYRIAIYPYPINDWEGMDYIVGGWQILLDRGTLLPEEIHGSPSARHPRTTIAVKRDGAIGVSVIDGRVEGIPGVTLEELANINLDLGYYTALELDGGGSSTCLLRNLETLELDIMNIPADGHLRAVPNAILIVGDPIEDDDPNITTSETFTFVETTTQETTTFYSSIFESITTSEEITSLEETTFTTTTNTTETSTTDLIKKTSSCFSFGGTAIFVQLAGVFALVWFFRKH